VRVREGVAGADGDDSDSPQSRPNARSKRSKPRFGGDIARQLDNYRKRRARELGWKTYMVFQKNVLMSVDREEPESLEALAQIPGLGPAKIERFGEEILEIVRVHRQKDRN
jgi:ATP-dependent DNA helicase RecQ